MLYRAPRPSVLARVRSVLVRVAGLVGSSLRDDNSYFDSLPDHHLRDLGVRRLNDRGETWYR